MTARGGSSDLVVVAAIAGAHGVRGNVRVRSFAAEPEDCFSYGPLLDKAGQVLLEAKHFHPAKDISLSHRKCQNRKKTGTA